MPAATIDPIPIAARFVTDTQVVISREKDPAAFGVLTIGAINAGSAPNIIPDSAEVKVNLRSQSPQVRKLLQDGTARVAKSAAAMRSEEHTSELQSLMRTSYAVFCLKKKKQQQYNRNTTKLIVHNLQNHDNEK